MPFFFAPRDQVIYSGDGSDSVISQFMNGHWHNSCRRDTIVQLVKPLDYRLIHLFVSLDKNLFYLADADASPVGASFHCGWYLV